MLGSSAGSPAANDVPVVSIDSDPGAVDLNYRRMVDRDERNLYPIVADLTSPSPALGWDNREVRSLTARGPAGLVMALALVHHLAIGNNTRFERLARFFASLGPRLLIEFVPPDDPMVVRLLAMRNHRFPWYTEQEFEAAFGRCYQIQRSDRIQDSRRRLYLMVRRGTCGNGAREPGPEWNNVVARFANREHRWTLSERSSTSARRCSFRRGVQGQPVSRSAPCRLAVVHSSSQIQRLDRSLADGRLCDRLV